MTDLRKAAEMALESLETLWDILDDIDTASDIAKKNDSWYRKRVESLQKKRWDTMITTDGYKLKDGPVEALRQALAQDALQKLAEIDHSLGLFIDEPPVKSYCGGKPNYCTEPEDWVKREQEPVAWINKDGWFRSPKDADDDFRACAYPLYTAPPKREWVGLTEEEFELILEQHNEAFPFKVYKAIEAKLKEKNV